MYYRKYFKKWIEDNIPKNRVIIYPYGDLGIALSKMLDDMGCEVLFFIDDYKKCEYCYKIEDAPLLDEKVILAVEPNNEALITKLKAKCYKKGYKEVDSIELFMAQIITQAYGVPNIANKHYIDKALKYFEPNCFKEFLLRGYPFDYLNKTKEMIAKGYPYDLNAKFQTLTKIENLYFYNDVIIEQNDIVVDAGTSYGWEQQITNFAKYTNNTVYGFEPNKDSFNRIKEETKEIKNIVIFNKALGDSNSTKFFVESSGGSMIVDYETDMKVETVKLDDILEHVDFIKMDIEGYELKALKGAKNLIKKCKPKLAICLYHKPEDIYEIPKFIKEIEPDYKLWIVCNEGFLWSGIKMFGIYYGNRK
ncbi:FkbM family methyltransferase [Hippea jasoniae]|uniref:FkbM family methyltransferase n=1 Tax=Hippea jasoniae TaxID=944479 RepID=UPI00068A159A|nr:FkbM family methyltransferase [Hippea jasoniae]